MEENIVLAKRRRRDSGFWESPAFNFGLKALIGIVVILIFLTLSQCTIEKPQAPTFVTDFAVPLVNKTYTIEEIIDKIDQPGLYIDSAGDVMFSISEELDTIRVSEDLQIDDISENFSESLGEIEIFPEMPSPISVNFSDYVSLSLGAVPPSSFDIQNNFQPLDNFGWATLSSGGLTIILANDFGVNLDTVSIQIYDIGYSRIISTIAVPAPGIPVNSTETTIVDLAGKTISNTLRLNIHCHTPGGMVLSLEDKSFSTALGISDAFVVTAAEAEIPSINRVFSQDAEISESNTIISAEISSGLANIQIYNGSAIGGTIAITLPDFRNDGTPYSTIRTINPNYTDNFRLDLDGYTFEPADQIKPQSITISAQAFLNSTAPSMVTVHESDSISVSIYISNLEFQSLTGIIDSTKVEFDSIATSFELPKGFDSLQLVNAELILEIENSINFAGTLEIGIVGNQGRTLSVTGNISAGTFADPMISSITVDDIANFLNPVPNSIVVNGSAILGDGSTIGTITASDFIILRVKISSPLEAVIGQTVFEGDINSSEIEQKDIDKITDHLLSASFNAIITNHLPIGVSVEIYFSADSTAVFSNPELAIGPIVVESGTIGQNGTVVSAVVSENIIALDSNDIKILEHPRLYSGQIITLAGSNGQTIKITGDDYVTAQGVIQAQYRIDSDLFDKGN
jgi:hypothetical protein